MVWRKEANMDKGTYRILIVLCLFTATNSQKEGSSEFVTKNCSLIEPIYNHTFDFSGLKSDLALTTTSSRGDIFDYNVCGDLSKPCAGRTGVAACMKVGSQEFVLGTQHELMYKNGKMFFTFINGSKCKDNTPYQLHVILGCDYTFDQIQSQVTPYGDGECSFYITLETRLACLPVPERVKSNSCSVKDPDTGYTYNLLALSDFNYRTSDRNGSSFVMNVCKPVLYGEAAMCPFDSSVCRVDMNESDPSKRFLNYGFVEPDPIVENSKLLIRYKSDMACNTTHNFTSVIFFNCDPTIEFGTPDFMGRTGCSYDFSWTTSKACNTVEPCVAMDPKTGFKYNMSSLKGKSFNIKLDNKTYIFGICSDAGSQCLDNAGACETSNGQSTSLGNTNWNLRFNQTGSPYLLYESGAACPIKTKDNASTTTTFWSTKIEFVCSSPPKEGSESQRPGDGVGSSSNGPKIIENSNCQLLIHYQTELACQNQITCKAKGYKSSEYEMDLTPLISTSDNYEAEVSPGVGMLNKKFFLNVCRPLVPKYGLGCPGGSAVCMAVMGQTTPENEQSLGYPEVSLIRINETSAELRYLHGSPCTSRKSELLSSSIQFTCDIRAGRGTPVLESVINDCHYQFMWPTNVICNAHFCEFDVNSCEIINKQLNERFNVRSANFTDKGKIKIHGSSGFTIDVCGDDHRIALSDYSQGRVKLFFTTQGPCGVDGSVNVQLRLVCSETEDAFSSSYGDQCNFIYTQRTPEICKFLGLAIPKSKAPVVVESTKPVSAETVQTPVLVVKKPRSLTSIFVVVITALGLLVYLGILIRRRVNTNRIFRVFQRRSSVVRYSRVDSNEEANLLLDHTGHLTDSDDDMLI